MSENDVKFREWFSGKGKEFFIKNGVKQGFRILEFGAGPGNYTIPLAQAAGPSGTVYAAESDHGKYPEIESKLKEYSVSNAVIHDTGGKIEPRLEPGFDFIAVYDVAHYFSDSDRNKLYDMVFKLLKKGGIFSLLPKHRREDAVPRGELGKMGWRKIKSEAEGHGFKYKKKITEEIVHDNGFVTESIMVFTK